MERIYKKAVILSSLPVILNAGISVYCYFRASVPQFEGYFVGTLLVMFFSFVWIAITRKVLVSNIMVLFTVSLVSFPVKIIFLAIIAFGGLFILKMDTFYFGVSFLLGTLLSLFVEVWFLIAANRFIRKHRSRLKSVSESGK
jgi:hypothetical protein